MPSRLQNQPSIKYLWTLWAYRNPFLWLPLKANLTRRRKMGAVWLTTFSTANGVLGSLLFTQGYCVSPFGLECWQFLHGSSTINLSLKNSWLIWDLVNLLLFKVYHSNWLCLCCLLENMDVYTAFWKGAAAWQQNMSLRYRKGAFKFTGFSLLRLLWVCSWDLYLKLNWIIWGIVYKHYQINITKTLFGVNTFEWRYKVRRGACEYKHYTDLYERITGDTQRNWLARKIRQF